MKRINNRLPSPNASSEYEQPVLLGKSLSYSPACLFFYKLNTNTNR